MEKEKKNEDIVYSKITGQRRPPWTRTRLTEPNLDLMAKAFINLHESNRNEKR